MDKLSLLYIIFWHHPTESMRDMAAQQILEVNLERSSEDSGHFPLMNMAESPNFSKEIRETAGMAAVDILKESKEDFTTLIQICENENILEKVREYAKENIDPIAKNSIDTLTKRGHYYELEEIIKNEKGYFSKETIELAKSNIGSAYSTAIKNMGHRNDINGLINMAKDQELPDWVRKKAGEKAIEETSSVDKESLLPIIQSEEFLFENRIGAGVRFIQLAIQQGDFSALDDLSKGDKVPESIRTNAKANIQNAIDNSIADCIERYDYTTLLMMKEESESSGIG
ncbi:MAG: hypothetical protein WC501_05535, partial [Candidatus Micrarchaeia archaeon]